MNPNAAPFNPRNPNPPRNPIEALGIVIDSIDGRVQQLKAQQTKHNNELNARLQAILTRINTLKDSPQFQQLIQAKQQLQGLQEQLQNAQQQLQDVQRELQQVTTQRDAAREEIVRLKGQEEEINNRIQQITENLEQKLNQYNTLLQNPEIVEVLQQIEAVVAEMNQQVQRAGKKATHRRRNRNRKNKRKTFKGGYVYKEDNTLTTNSVVINSTATRSMSRNRKRTKNRNKSRTN